VRELRNCVERAVLLSNSNTLTVDDIDPNRERLLPRKTDRTMEIVLDRDKKTRSPPS
jgi:DNA-binding NtrC family response regulator